MNPVSFSLFPYRGRLVLLALVVAVISLLLGRIVFRQAPITTDEHAYVFQAHCFADRTLARPLPEPVRMFPHEMMIMDEEAGWLSRYPPAHAAWLAPGALVGHPRLMVALAGACSLILLGFIGRETGVGGMTLPVLAVFSPYFLFMHGTLLSHTSGLVAVCALLLAYLRWKRTGAWPWAALAGLAWGWFFLNRTWTGVLVAIPFGLDALATLGRKRTAATLVGTLAFAGCSALGAVAFLLYNHAAVGDPWTPTYLFYQPSDTLGFGPRPPGAIPSHHTPELGLKALVENLFLLDRWLFGFPGSLVLCLLLALVGWRRRLTPLLLGVPVLVWLGYVFFWFEGIRLVGPVYYYETLPFLLLAAGLGLKRIHSRLEGIPLVRRRLYVRAAVLCAAGGSLLFSWQQGIFLRDWQKLTGDYHRLLRTAPKRSLILVEQIPGMNYVTRGMAYNPEGLASDPLVVHRGKLPDSFLALAFPERVPYRLVLREQELALEPYRAGQPLVYRWMAADTPARTGEVVETADRQRLRRAVAGQHPPEWLSYGAHFWVTRGRYLLKVRIKVEGVSGQPPLEVDVAAEGGRRILARARIAPGTDRLVEIPFTVADRTRIEPRLFFSGSGTVQAGHMEIVRIGDSRSLAVLDSDQAPEG